MIKTFYNQRNSASFKFRNLTNTFVFVLILGNLSGFAQKINDPKKKSKQRYYIGTDYLKKSNKLISKGKYRKNRTYQITIKSILDCSKNENDLINGTNNLGVLLLYSKQHNEGAATKIFRDLLLKSNDTKYDIDFAMVKFNLAVALIIEKNYFASLSILQSLDESVFAKNGINYYKGIANYYLNNLKTAEAEFNEDITLGSKGRSQYALGYLKYKQGKFKESENLLIKSSKKVDRDLLFWTLGNVTSLMNKHKQSLTYFNKISNSPSLQYNKTISLAGQNNSLFKINSAKNAIKRTGQKILKYETLYTSAVSEYLDLYYNDAIKLYSKAITKNQEYKYPYLGRAITLSRTGGYRESILDYTAAIKLDNHFWLSYEGRAVSYFMIENKSKGIADIEFIIQNDTNYIFSYDALSGYAFALLDANRLDDAIKYFNKLIAQFPNKSAGYSGLGIINFGNREYTEALAYFDKAARLNPKESNNFTNKGNCNYALSNYITAENDFRIGIKLNPNNTSALNGLGMSLGKNKKFKEAKIVFNKALYLKPMDYTLYCNYGMCLGLNASFYKDLNQLDSVKIAMDSAQYMLAKMVSLGMDSSIYHINLGYCYQSLNELIIADNYYNLVKTANKFAAENNKGVLLALSNDQIKKNEAFTFFNSAVINNTYEDYEAPKINLKVITEQINEIASADFNTKNDYFTSTYFFSVVMDFTPTSKEFDITPPPYLFEPEMEIIVENLPIYNTSSGPCLRISPKERQAKIKERKARKKGLIDCNVPNGH